jgi:hypothetical protein
MHTRRGARTTALRTMALWMLAFVLVAGCGEKGGARDMHQLVEDLGCTGYEAGLQILTREAGSCTFEGETVYLQTFNSKDQQDQWLSVGGDAGGQDVGSGLFVVGDRWVVQGFDGQTVQKIAKKLGGKVAN